MNPLTRSPQGKFIDKPSALRYWLHVMLNAQWDSCGQRIAGLLELAAQWCRLRAALELEKGAEVLRRAADNDWEPHVWLEAQRKSLNTAIILRDCAAKVREVWK